MKKGYIGGLIIAFLLGCTFMITTPVFSQPNEGYIGYYVPQEYLTNSEKLNITFNKYDIILNGQKVAIRENISVFGYTVPSTMTYKGIVFVPLERAATYFNKDLIINSTVDTVHAVELNLIDEHPEYLVYPR